MRRRSGNKVILNRDALQCCLCHALSSEQQEVMGLLLGQVSTDENNDKVACVERALVLTRRDKKKDRVEVGYEHLATASTIAEQLSDIEKNKQNVIGWYHSHPHITVLPSHVDVKTQGLMQMLDSNFLGLIFSVFDDKSGDMNICALQSMGVGSSVDDCSWQGVEIPIKMTSFHSKESSVDHDTSIRRRRRIHKKESLINLQQNLLDEVQQSFDESLGSCNHELERSRLTAVYQSNLLRIMDVQLLPTLNSLQSLHQSLKIERDRLMESLGTSEFMDSCSSEKTPDDDITSMEKTRAIIAALDVNRTRWSQSSRVLRRAFTGVECVVTLPVDVQHNVMNIVDSNVSVSQDYVCTAVVRVVCSNLQRIAMPSPSAIYPWSIEVNIVKSVGNTNSFLTEQFPSSLTFQLISIRRGRNARDVELEISGVSTSSCTDNVSCVPHALLLTFDEDCDDYARCWYQDLPEALRLNNNIANTVGIKDVNDECVVDMTATLTQDQ